MTSNTEKNLPDAFLRRCVYYHIDFPNPEQLYNIVATRLSKLVENNEQAVRNAIRYFNKIRETVNRRPPATAELLAWLKILEVEGFMKNDVDFNNLSGVEKNILNFSHAVLVKNKADLDLLG
jgi:MoxR-like ATPase